MENALNSVKNSIGFFVDNPLVFGAIVVVVLALYLRRKYIRSFKPDHRRDPKRAFSAKQKATGVELCGGRCEYVNVFGFRCREMDRPGSKLAADHHESWSRGGPTSDRNLVMLCTHHNSKKSAKWPSWWYTTRLSLSRKRYFPKGVPTRPSRRA